MTSADLAIVNSWVLCEEIKEKKAGSLAQLFKGQL